MLAINIVQYYVLDWMISECDSLGLAIIYIDVEKTNRENECKCAITSRCLFYDISVVCCMTFQWFWYGVKF